MTNALDRKIDAYRRMMPMNKAGQQEYQRLLAEKTKTAPTPSARDMFDRALQDQLGKRMGL